MLYSLKNLWIVSYSVYTAMQNVQCQNMTCHHQEGLMSNVRAGVLYLWSRISFNWTFLVYTSKSNTEFQDSFMSLRTIFDLSFYQKLVAGQHQVKKCKYKPYFRVRLCCKYCFSMLRDKMLFVIKLQKLKKASLVLPSFAKKWTHQNVGNSSKWL